MGSGLAEAELRENGKRDSGDSRQTRASGSSAADGGRLSVTCGRVSGQGVSLLAFDFKDKRY